MDILNPATLRQKAQMAMRRGREPKKLIYAFAGIQLALSVLLYAVNFWLDSKISGTGGLSNIGTRAIFSTAQQALPLLSGFVSMCLDLGFLAGLMRISRGQYADHTDLKTGFRKFWPLVRLVLLQTVLYFALAFLALQLGTLLFSFTPWAEPLMEILYPLAASENAVVDEAVMMEMAGHMGPLLITISLIFLIALIPFLFRMRMAFFCLLDDPRGRAMAAIRESSRMMRGKFGQMMKLDLSLWLYYAATALGVLVLYSDLILVLLGIDLGLSFQVMGLIAFLGSGLVQFASILFLRPQAEVAYLLAYDSLREKPKDNGVVLGNIFDM
jgi:uncharacterized membrane protein